MGVGYFNLFLLLGDKTVINIGNSLIHPYGFLSFLYAIKSALVDVNNVGFYSDQFSLLFKDF